MDFTEHQAIFGVHLDTDNRHLHIAVNRVHPDTLKVIKPNKGFDLEAAHQAIARIEHLQGWKREERGRYQVEASGALARDEASKAKPRQPSQPKRDMEQRTGEKSAGRIAIECAGDREEFPQLVCADIRITSHIATNEMVRRLILLSCQEDRRGSFLQGGIIGMQIKSVGIDLGKTTFHLVALGAAGKLLVKKKFTQKQLLAYTANLQTSLIGLEACAGAQFLGRALRQQGHDVRLIPAQFVKPFVKSNKNDFVDAEAIAEAFSRKNMRFVPIKTDDQLDLQAIHRVRDRLVARRTSVINQIRAFLLERGLVFEKKPAKLKSAMADVLENAEADLTPLMRNLINTLWGEWKTVEQQVEELNDELERISVADAGCTRIRKIPGIGPID